MGFMHFHEDCYAAVEEQVFLFAERKIVDQIYGSLETIGPAAFMCF